MGRDAVCTASVSKVAARARQWYTGAMSGDRRVRSMRWLLMALGACALINAAIVAGLMASGRGFDEAYEASGLLLTSRILGTPGVDSWRPMAYAYLRDPREPGGLYWAFLVKHVKFQYPPSSLLAFKLLPRPLTYPISPQLSEFLALPSLIAVLFTILCSALLLFRLTSESRAPWWRVVVSAVSIGLLGVTYYPLTKGHSLGQIQVYLGALAAAALLLHAWNQRVLSGTCLGLCCLIKPQYGLVLVWGLLRRDKRFVLGFAVVFLLGLALSLAEFGLANHLQYLEVLKQLSRHGEAYGPNQSVNGLVQRWLGNGNAIKFQARGFPPENPIVYYATLVSSALIAGLALFMPTAPELRGRTLDLAVVMCAATMASPIAWEHHYGAFFPAFALAMPVAMSANGGGWLLLASYVLMANELTRHELVFSDRWVGLLGSHIFFGALLLFGILLVGRWRGTRAGLRRARPVAAGG
jgi:alpha-1,2-mannosyltransferase